MASEIKTAAPPLPPEKSPDARKSEGWLLTIL